MNAVSRKKEQLDILLKADIVKVVLALIKKDQPITMSEVASRCGVAKGTLYNYFENKECLLNYVHQTILTPLRESKKATFESSKEPLPKLLDFVDDVFDIYEDFSIYFRFVQRKKSLANENSERFEVFIRPLAKVCSQGIEKGMFVDVDPYLLAEMIYGTTAGALMSIPYRGDENISMQQVKRDAITLITKIIR